MKLSDTMEVLLNSKGEDRVLWVEPDQCVYEAIEKMAKCGVGVLLKISEGRLVWNYFRARLRAQSNLDRAFLEADACERNHDKAGRFRGPAADG
jgi:hypothetical protein